ncbi:hypothetical protein BH11PLA1_BH11PLA1_01950 [soil metagenome]
MITPTVSPPEDILLPAAPSEHVRRLFTWWTARMIRRSFSAVRIAAGTAAALRALDAGAAPLIVAMNHQTWWDPLLGIHLAAALTPSRRMLAPMEMAQLRKFAIFRRLGVFGLAPDDPRALAAMRAYLAREFARGPAKSLWITPQGEFVDVRTPVRIRPGVAAVAAATRGAGLVCIALEITHWLDRRPEVLIRIARVAPPQGDATIAAWTRTLTTAMRANAAALALLVQSRDPAAFEIITSGRAARVNPLYDAWLWVRGKPRTLDATPRPSRAARRLRAADEKPAAQVRA